MTPDELALVARLRGDGKEQFADNDEWLAADLICALAARVPTAKPLVWEYHREHGDAQYWKAKSVHGKYCYGIDLSGRCYWKSVDGEWDAPTLALAQDAAEGDNQARWLAEWAGWAQMTMTRADQPRRTRKEVM